MILPLQYQAGPVLNDDEHYVTASWNQLLTIKLLTIKQKQCFYMFIVFGHEGHQLPMLGMRVTPMLAPRVRRDLIDMG